MLWCRKETRQRTWCIFTNYFSRHYYFLPILDLQVHIQYIFLWYELCNTVFHIYSFFGGASFFYPILYLYYFLTSVIIYISRFIFQLIDLYKSLLEKILDIQDKTSIRIEHFDKIVEKHFPLSNEIFNLFVKIMFSCLFFAIIYDTMQTVGYIRFGAQPDLITVISLIFLFGTPRLL